MSRKNRSIPSTTTATSKNLAKERMESADAVMGIYIAEVTSTKDLARTGRIQVFISALSKDKEQNTGLYECLWVSPFAGATPAEAVGKKVEQFKNTQKSYGMWMIPPDVGNMVVVAFGNGNTKFPLCLGCLIPDVYNHMVPGMAAGKSFGDPTVLLPVAEKNRRDDDPSNNDTVRPVHADIAAQIVAQGLINDPVRGAGTASSRRESPSEVFGILTPGPREPGNPDNRVGGHQFIMDDNLQSRMIRLRTAGGNQILMDDGTGSIYMINKGGKGWMEIDTFGNINVFGEGSISMRAKGNFNLRADKNINIEAGNNVHIKAAGDNVGDQYKGINPLGALGLPALGTGGNIRLEAAADLTQYAALNAQLTAVGGDIDFNAAGRVAVASSGPFGIQMLATTGPIAMQSAQATTILSAAAFGVTAGAAVGITAPTILLNSGGPPGIPAIPAIPAPPIGVSEFKDQSSEPPEFDFAAALKGESAVKNNGQRPGDEVKIKTIVTNLVTAEPYAGHYQGDPHKDDPFARAADPEAVASLPPDAADFTGGPADVQTPDGMKAGTGYVDSNGNTLTTKASAVTERVGGALDSVTNDINSAINGIPTYADVQNAINDFKTAAEQKLLEITGIQKLVDGIKIAIPPIRFPTITAAQQKIIGTMKELQELEAQARQFAIDAQRLPTSLQTPAIAKLRNTVAAVLATAVTGAALVSALQKEGVSVVADNTGSLIFQDRDNNLLIDFSRGLGDIGDTLAIAADFNQTFTQIDNAILAPLSNNQTLALSSFAHHIGVENFLNSNVLAALNEGKYQSIPRLMKTWVMGPIPNVDYPTPLTDLIYREDYAQRRSWESEIFQSPDNLSIAPPENSSIGEVNFQTQADCIRLRRDEFIKENVPE